MIDEKVFKLIESNFGEIVMKRILKSIFGGAVVLLTYAIHRQDPVFIVGQSLGSIVYIRNLILIARKKKALASMGVKNEL